jgi:hypothetical protein
MQYKHEVTDLSTTTTQVDQEKRWTEQHPRRKNKPVAAAVDQVVGTCECGNELSGSRKCGEFLD